MNGMNCANGIDTIITLSHIQSTQSKVLYRWEFESAGVQQPGDAVDSC